MCGCVSTVDSPGGFSCSGSTCGDPPPMPKLYPGGYPMNVPSTDQRFSAGYPYSESIPSYPTYSAYPSAMDSYIGMSKSRPTPYSMNPEYPAYFSRVAGLHQVSRSGHVGYDYGSG